MANRGKGLNLGLELANLAYVREPGLGFLGCLGWLEALDHSYGKTSTVSTNTSKKSHPLHRARLYNSHANATMIVLVLPVAAIARRVAIVTKLCGIGRTQRS